MKKPKARDAGRATEDLGLRCPKCGCRRAPVLYTRKSSAGIRRVRLCEFCGRRFSTLERT